VGIIPFKINELTLNVNPIKLREYMSAGLPIVSTPLPEVCNYGDYVEFGEDVDSFTAAIERALNTRDAASVRRRRDAMRQETWVAKVEQLSNIVTAIRQETTAIDSVGVSLVVST
jgi:glycosyltransferase involved in cell wall biosynthesis